MCAVMENAALAPIPSLLRHIPADSYAGSENVWQYSRPSVVNKGAGRYILLARVFAPQENAKGVVAAAWALGVGRGDQPRPRPHRRGKRKVAFQVAGNRQRALRQCLQPLDGIASV